MKKRFLTVLLVLTMGVTMFCGFAPKSIKTTGASVKAQKDVTLTFTYNQSGSNDPLEKWMKEKNVVSRFEAQNPGVHIKLVPISSTDGDYATLLALKLSSERTSPDIFMEDTYMTATDAAAGHLACLDNYLTKWSDYKNYMGGAKEAVKGMDGKSYGVPISTDARGIFYNISVFKKAGIKTPWQPKTWNDILDAARKINKSGQNAAPLYLIVGSSSGEGISMQTFEMLLYGTGDKMYKNKKWLVGSKSIVDTFNFINTVYVKENLGVKLDVALAKDCGTKVAQGMANGTVGMMLGVCTSAGNWIPTGSFPVENLESKIGFAAMPTQNGGKPATVTMSGGWSWAISKYCKNKDLAFKFLAFCGDKENASYRSIYDGRVSPRIDSIKVKEYADRPYINEIMTYMKNANVRPKSESYPLVSTQIQTLVGELVSGSLTPQQAADEYKTKVIGIVGKENTFTK